MTISECIVIACDCRSNTSNEDLKSLAKKAQAMKPLERIQAVIEGKL